MTSSPAIQVLTMLETPASVVSSLCYPAGTYFVYLQNGQMYLVQNNGGGSQTTSNLGPPDINDSVVYVGAIQTLLNKTFVDVNTFFQNSSDTSKKFRFDCSHITTGTTRGIIIPDINDTLVTLTATQILSNKTLNQPTISSIQNIGLLVLPTNNDTILGRNTIDTLTNKNMTSGTNTWPTFNQSTSGSAASLSATLVVGQGGTGATTYQAALNNLAVVTTSGSYLRGNGTNVAMNTIQVGDVPTLNQNTTGTAGGLTGTPAISISGLTLSAASASLNGFTQTFPSASGTLATTGNGELFLNKSFQDTNCMFVNNVDATKAFLFDCSGISTSSIRTYVVPNTNATLVGRDTTDTLTNKNLTSGTNTFPTFNQNTSGSAASLSATLPINRGGTNATTAQTAMNNLAGAVTSGSYLRGNGTNVVMNAGIPSSDITGYLLGSTTNFTPTIADDLGAAFTTVVTTNSNYTQVGSTYFVTIDIAWSGKGTANATHAIRIGFGNLGFTPTQKCTGSLYFTNGMTFASSQVYIGCDGGNSYCVLPYNNGAGAMATTLVSAANTAGEIIFSIVLR